MIGVHVFPHFDFPVKVAVDTAGIGGPSAGLAMTLAILDDLTPGDLTGGKRVAVTGTIDPEGNVGEIGGIEQKAVAAQAAGAQLFIVPAVQPARSAPSSCRHARRISRAAEARRVEGEGGCPCDVRRSARSVARKRRCAVASVGPAADVA